MFNYKNKAFTLVELIVVITILAILGTIAFIGLQGYSKSARDSRRVSDIANIKTSLELFILNSGFYPQPDVVGSGAVYYSGDLLWTQGTVGNNVSKNLSRNLQNKPLDPLFDIEYVYSVANSNKEYQLMALYEKEISKANNIINNTYAANAYNIKVEGTYNEIFLKTPNYIVPVPSIITSEETPFDFEAGAEKIESMVVTNGTNFPKLNIPNTTTQTGGLTGVILSATGRINSDSSNQEKISVINAIQSTYIGSSLATKTLYKNILDKTNDGDKLELSSMLVLNEITEMVSGSCGVDEGGSFSNTPTNLCSSGIASIVTDGGEGNNYTWDCNGISGGINESCSATHISPYANCTTGGQILSASSTYGSCDTSDITVCSGEGIGYTIAACNVGTNTAGTSTASFGGLFQWGNHFDFRAGQFSDGQNYSPISETQVSSISDYSIYSDSTFIKTPSGNDWTSLDIDGLLRSANWNPCAENYHVPTKLEFIGIVAAGDGVLWDISGTTTEGTDMKNALKLPMAGSRTWTTGETIYQTTYGDYWSSTPLTNNNANYFSFNSTGIYSYGGTRRASGYAIRCFKN